jgi:hypothetical protein
MLSVGEELCQLRMTGFGRRVVWKMRKSMVDCLLVPTDNTHCTFHAPQLHTCTQVSSGHYASVTGWCVGNN